MQDRAPVQPPPRETSRRGRNAPPPGAAAALLVALVTGVGCRADLVDGSHADRPAEAEAFGSDAGLRRLTRYEYAATVEDLLGVTVDANAVPKESILRGHSVIAGQQRVGYADVDAFLALGLEVGAEASPRLLAESRCEDSACLEPILEDLLRRAFRGPIEDVVRERYLRPLDAPDAGATLEQRLTTVIGAILSSPRFLHRREVSADGVGTVGRHSLDGPSIASRLSYLVWQSGPDAELLAAADRGELADAEGRKRHLDRLLADPRARRGARGFVREWLSVFDNHVATKSASVVDGLPADAPAELEESFELTIDDTLFGASDSGEPPSGRLVELLRTTRFFGREAMQTLLGTGPAVAGQPLPKGTGPRLGLLTHPFVLAAHTKESGASPFPIGKFVFESLLCETIPPPPADIPTVSEDDATGQTFRQRLESVTNVRPCSNCHDRIGPPGFAFLPFDPLGRYRDADGAGAPWDTSGTLLLAQAPPRDEHGGAWTPPAEVPFADTNEMLTALADAETVQSCAARRLFRFAYGRFEVDSETSARALSTAVVESRGAWVAALNALVSAPEFVEMRIAE